VQSTAVPLRVVGIVSSVHQDGLPAMDPQPFADQGGVTAGMQYWGVTSNEAVEAAAIPWGTLNQLYSSVDKGGPAHASQLSAFWSLHWEYSSQLRLDLINTNDLTGYQGERYQAMLEMQDIPGMQLDKTSIFTTVPDILYGYAQHIIFAQVAVSLLLVSVLGLVLIFLGQMAHTLVERQEPLIATLRSRGASRRQLFTAFATQGLGLGVLAFLAGPLLAIPLVRLVAERLLPPHREGALALLEGNALVVAAHEWAYAAIAAGVTVIVLLVALGRAARQNVLAQRQEATRGAARRPLWQRLYLDVLAALLALAGFGTYTLALQLAAVAPSSANTTVRAGLAPLALVAPIFLMIAGALLFLRLLPLLLQLGERLALRRRGASGVLAFTQLARAPRSAQRVTLLLALSICFVVFALSAQTTASQRILDVAAHQTGADFSGGIDRSRLAAGRAPTQLAPLTAAYQALPGVLSASLAYRTIASLVRLAPGPVKPFDGEGGFVQIAAVDVDTFAQTVIWSPQDSTQPLADLLAPLRAHRAEAATADVVYALVDAEVTDLLHLSTGARFALPIPGYDSGEMHFIVVAQVARIPTTYNAAITGTGPGGTGGILVDYQSFAAVYARDTNDVASQAVAPDYVWLRTKDDAASLTSVRAAIGDGPLRLRDLDMERGLNLNVVDRRALIQQLHADPMRVDIIGVLALAAAAVLGLGLLGALLAVWLWLRRQRPAFALLRALGLEPRRLGCVLFCEQGIVYAAALLVGALLGAALSLFAAPPLVDLIAINIGSADASNLIYDGGPPVRLVLPLPLLAAMLGGLVLICALAMALSARLTVRPALGQTLRLDQS
jgi:ABC-type antimicrobial peptide transport system permease subunit